MTIEQVSERHLNYDKILEKGLKGVTAFEHDLRKTGSNILNYLDDEGQIIATIDRPYIAMIRGAMYGAYNELCGDNLRSLADKVLVETYANITSRMKDRA